MKELKTILSHAGYYFIIMFILLGLLILSVPVSDTSGKYVFSEDKTIELKIVYK